LIKKEKSYQPQTFLYLFYKSKSWEQTITNNEKIKLLNFVLTKMCVKTNNTVPSDLHCWSKHYTCIYELKWHLLCRMTHRWVSVSF